MYRVSNILYEIFQILAFHKVLINQNVNELIKFGEPDISKKILKIKSDREFGI